MLASQPMFFLPLLPLLPIPPVLPIPPSLTDHVPGVPVVFAADELLQLDVRRQRGVDSSCPRLPKRSRIVEGDRDLEMAEIGAAQPLGDVKLVAVRLALEIEPPAVAKANRINHQRVAVPGADLVAKPERPGARRVGTSRA